MRVALEVTHNPQLAQKLENNADRIRRHFGERVLANADPYTPFDTGIMKNTATITPVPNGVIIGYHTPYAQYQWRNQYVNYSHPNGLRGPRWIQRMWQDRGAEISRATGLAICKILEEPK